MSVPQTINNDTAAVIQPVGPFAAESPAVTTFPQDDIPRFIKEEEVREETAPQAFHSSWICRKIVSSSFEADRDFVKQVQRLFT
ncbi:uncharacterized protein BYT42DRAFT_614269 [Radiomyces spectabilis]|uniref:uncharacterized protein n=1 Tax=Radiomyces spectabilis TaxID=64574 RepID=UPI00221F3F28|nr:uncharacterized protein BYT42DRAFT_614269 [Radiomyces spectabilis]KAI8377598.1 hypothetical protein BYT42DRAFT_614269 [Radiomyces spectabilis]